MKASGKFWFSDVSEYRKISVGIEWVNIVLYQALQKSSSLNGNFLHKWFRVFNNGPSKICGRQPSKKFEGIWTA